MKKVVVLGSGESGVGAALLAKEKGYDVFVSDNGEIAEQYIAELHQAEIAYESGGHTWDSIVPCDILIKSPGIPDSIQLIQSLQAEGINPISEIEFAFTFCKTKIIAITGSNGKTTTTALTHHLFSGSGLSSKIGGNYGVSFARLLLEGSEPDVYVLELSSFQLDGIETFRPDVAMILNITPDHLDRYNYDLEKYAASKMSIAKNMTSNDLLILNGEDDNVRKQYEKLKQSKQDLPIVEKVFPKEIKQHITGIKNKKEFGINNITLDSVHNRFNTQCAVIAAEHVGVSFEHIQKQLNSFAGLEHRMERIRMIGEVSFINDSKATNVDAVEKALVSVEAPVIWIAGGTDKGNDYTQIQELVKLKVKALICLGVDNTALKNAFQDIIPVIKETQQVDQVAQEALRLAEGNATILLSPACASFDLFDNYIDRGNQWKNAVMAL